MPKIRVLVVDDSAFMRVLISKILEESGFVDVVGTARDGGEGVEKVLQLHPDVIILDILMPKMNGIEALQKIMSTRPTPTLILSALDRSQIASAFEAVEYGAIDFLQKPGGTKADRVAPLETIKREILTKVKHAATAQLLPPDEFRAEFEQPIPESAQELEPIPIIEPLPDIENRIIVIGTSTGGPRIVPILLNRLPSRVPPIVIIQHMPPEFTEHFAKSLNNQCQFSVSEAVPGEKLRPGHVYVAKGGYHLNITSPKTIKLTEDPPVNYVRPAIDVTLASVAKVYGDKAAAVILTGMGNDGREGARLIKQHGGLVIVEDKSTAIIFGMPKAVIDAGLADVVAPVHRIPLELKKRGWIVAS